LFKKTIITPLPTFVDFFAGVLVTQGAKQACTPVWSNDICLKKAAIYTANHGPGHFHLRSIEHVIQKGFSLCPTFPQYFLSESGVLQALLGRH
jgi:DNA (cytosine-5)-methyltransferase 1